MNEIEGIPVGRVLVIGNGKNGKSVMNDMFIQLALEHGMDLKIAEAEVAGVLHAGDGVGLSFDSMWLDDLQVVESDDKPANIPYGPQPKGKKGKVRKW
jgi:archaellum biogenesis ATPase FlaH